MSSYSAADKRRVFLACRSMFSGQNAYIRRSKAIRRLVPENSKSFAALIKDFGYNKTVNIIMVLLEYRIFESELKAKAEFPELFQTSPARIVQHTKSENDAARSEAEALASAKIPDASGECSVLDPPEEPPRVAAGKTPSLYPLSLPYNAQHTIFTTVQQQLEECCFDFAKKWFPQLLEDNEWDCAEAVELTKWINTLPRLCEKLPSGVTHGTAEPSLQHIFVSTTALRNSAVHRLPASSKGIQNMIQSATRLAITLGDMPRAAQLELLKADIESRIKDMQLHKNFLENRLDEQLKVIAKERAELDRREEETVATTLKEDKENTLLIGSLLNSTIRKAFSANVERGRETGTPENALLTWSNEDGGQKERIEVVGPGGATFVAVAAEDTGDESS